MIQKFNKKIEFQNKTKQEAETQMTELTEKLKSLEEKAQSKGLNLDEIYNEKEDGASSLTKNPQVYDRK